MENQEKIKIKGEKKNTESDLLSQFANVFKSSFNDLISDPQIGDLSEIEVRLGTFDAEKFTSGVDIKVFGELHQFCKQRCEFDGELSNTLDIFAIGNSDRERLSITDTINIQQYCLQSIVNTHDDCVSVISKNLIKHNDLTDYNIRLSHSHETPIQKDDNLIQKIVGSRNKTFRLKSRMSYNFDSLRIDLTQVKSANGSDMTKSKVLSSPETYEIECEFINLLGGKGNFKLSPIETDLIYKILCIKNRTFNLMKKPQISTILNNYYQLIGIPNYSAQKIVSLNPHQLQPTTDNDPRTCMLNTQGYAVTYKIDGLHNMLFIDDNSLMYLVDDSKNVNYLGYKADNSQKSIFECELYKNDDDTYGIYIFDCLFYNNVDVRPMPLVSEQTDITGNYIIKLPVSQQPSLSSRLSHVYNLKVSVTEKTRYDFFIKNHIYSEGQFFSITQNFIKNEKSLKTRTDGLVFTKVNQQYPSQSGGTNNTIFKYKPVEHLSIDFLVTFPNGRKPVIEGDRAIIKLMVFGKSKTGHNRYGLEEFTTTSIQLTDGLLKTRDGLMINNNSIAEFVKQGQYWVPIRLRPDKQQPNSKFVVDDTIKTIDNPITTDMICGKTPVDKTYISSRGDKIYTQNLSKYHNEIKNTLLETVSQKIRGSNISAPLHLSDFGCGRACDSNKWISNNITHVLGIDNSKDQIDGGNNRLIENKAYVQQKAKRVDINLVVGNLARPLEQCVEPEDIAEFNKTLSKFIYNCDIVTCNFAVHYFFNNQPILDTFLSNVSKCLKNDGYFIGTMMDGGLVHKLLLENNGKYVVNNSEGINMLTITAKYSLINPVGLNRPIDVTFAGLIENKTEYVVDSTDLIANASKHGLISSEISVDSMERGNKLNILNMQSFTENDLFPKLLSKDFGNLSESDKEISKLYKVFVFKKQKSQKPKQQFTIKLK